MKTLLYFGCLATVVLSLNACNKDSLSPDETTGAARTTATDSLHRHPSGPGSLTAVAPADLPAPVTAYINANYAGATIKEARKDGNGNLVVLITLNGTVKLLAFKADGTFVKELEFKDGHAPGDTTQRPRHAPGDTARHHAPGDTAYHHGPAPLTTVAVADLPAPITAYINANYAGATIKRSGKNTQTGDFLVEIITTDNKRVGLIFGSDGTFKKAFTGR